MSSTNKTANLELNQWVGTDPVLMADFNADNAKIDAAVAALQNGALRSAFGSYTGDGTGQKTLSFDFPPKLLIVTHDTSNYAGSRIIALRGQTFAHNTHDNATNMGYSTMLTWNGNSVTLTSASQNGTTSTSDSFGAFNYGNKEYRYFAIG